jgi:membrane-associated protein
MFRDAIAHVSELPPVALVAVVFLLAFAETALFFDLVVPGEVGMVFAGAAAHEADIPLLAVIAAGVFGALLGDTTSFWMGRVAGPRLVHRSRWTQKHFGGALQRAQRYFERAGAVAIVGGRFIGALRAVVPFVAGSAGMGFGRFLGWNFVASLGWASAVVSAGYLFGDDVASVIDRVGTAASVAVIAVVIAAIVWRRRSSGRQRTESGAQLH